MIHVTVERANYTINRIYRKDFGKRKHRLRVELQEYPNKNPFDAINEKINLDTTASFQDSELPPQVGTLEN
jgi:hypothetical protein